MITQKDLALGVIKNIIDKIPDVNFVLINEPILISGGRNSTIRYNYYYPRWAFDQFREIFSDFTNENQIKYFDFWNLVPDKNFTNSAIHLDLTGEKLLAGKIQNIIEKECEN
jgi:hypothetical protein